MLVKTKTECFLLGKNGLQKEVKRELKRGQIFRLEYPSCENKQVAMIEEIKSDYFQGFKCVDLKKFQFLQSIITFIILAIILMISYD